MMVASFTGCGKSSSKYLMDIDYSDYVKLCDYKGVEATKVVFEVTDEDVQEEIEYNMYDYVTYDDITDRGVEEGDYANVTYTATIDGEVNEDYSGEEEEIFVGEGYTYPELEDALHGMKTGDTKKVEVELTADFAEEDMVGKKAILDVTLNSVSVENLPEYNLDFVKENTEFDTIEEYEKSVKESLETYKEDEYAYAAQEEIFAYILENSEFNGYPEELYTKCEKLYDESNEYYASMYGMELDEFMELFGLDEETKKQEIEANVNYELVIGAIAQEEGIDCTEKEINEYVEEIYLDYGYDSAEDFLEDYTAEDIGYELIYQKVAEFLYDKAKLVEMSEEDYLAAQETEYYEEGDVEGQEAEEFIIEEDEEVDDSTEEEQSEETSDSTEAVEMGEADDSTEEEEAAEK